MKNIEKYDDNNIDYGSNLAQFSIDSKQIEPSLLPNETLTEIVGDFIILNLMKLLPFSIDMSLWDNAPFSVTH